MSIPLLLRAGLLTPADFHRFTTLFAKSASDFFPDYNLHLIPLEEGGDKTEDWAEALAAIKSHGLPVVDQKNRELFLPIWAEKALCGVLMVHGGEPHLYAMPESWLEERSHIISREFHLFKQASLDPATGFLNGFHLESELDALIRAEDQCSTPSSLALLEVHPRSLDADRNLRSIVRAGACLASILGEEMHLHHLGAGIFGLLWHGIDRDEARGLGDDLLLRLKREGFASVHLGITAVVPPDPEEVASGEQLLEQAWQALRVARKRGPFNLCRHMTAADIASHPLRKFPETALQKISRLSRGKARFSLALLSLDQEPASGYFSRRVCAAVDQYPGAELILLNQREAFLFLNAMGSVEALSWLEGFRKKMEELELGSFSIGLTDFPFHDCTKSALPGNCRKALHHARFLGPGSLAVFDAVSLNISGDVFYEEGDLVRAMEEYRRGLLIDPSNLNLLNSLGVTCVQMNRNRAAKSCFEKALSVDGANFMALFNLGFILLGEGDKLAAKKLWEQALAVDCKHTDLLRHLGILACRLGEYPQARELLGRCEQEISSKPQQGGEPMVVARWLGRAHEACGELSQAIVAYQRAVSGNPRDAGSLSRLGRLYALTGQGMEIALSLCRQAVELDGGKADHWFRLGQVQSLMQDLPATVFALGECLRLAPAHPDADRLLTEILADPACPDAALALHKKSLPRKQGRLAPKPKTSR